MKRRITGLPGMEHLVAELQDARWKAGVA